jgi:hypothetical protein
MFALFGVIILFQSEFFTLMEDAYAQAASFMITVVGG